MSDSPMPTTVFKRKLKSANWISGLVFYVYSSPDVTSRTLKGERAQKNVAFEIDLKNLSFDGGRGETYTVSF